MKKFLLLAAAAFACTAASAQWAVVGSYSNWNFDQSTKLQGEGDNLSCTIEKLTTGFKIVDITNNNWDVQYGTSEAIVANKTYTLQGKNGGADPSNIEFGNMIQEIKNAQVNWNPSTFELEIVASESDIVTGYPTLYVTGSFCNWDGPGTGASVPCALNNGIYTATVNLGSSGNVEFKLAGEGWSNEIAGGVEVGMEPVTVTNGGDNLKTTLTGERVLTFDINNMQMYFGEASEEVEPDAAVWAVVGAYCDWKFENATVLEGEGDVLECTIENLTNDFKIVNITIGWDSQMGTATPVEIGETYILEGKVDGNDASNITFADLILSVKNATVTWNPTTAELKVVGAESDIVTGYPTLYVTGSFNGWVGPGEEGTILMTEEDGVFTANVNFTENDYNDNGFVEFKVAGQGWTNEIAGGVEVLNEPVAVTKGGANLFTNLIGEMTLVLNYDEMTMYFIGGTTSVEGLEVENNAEVVYYNLQGVKVQNPAKGIYIIKQGNETRKAVIR